MGSTTIGLTGLALLGIALGAAGCDKSKDDCVRVVCDFTHVSVNVVDNDGDASDATSVSFTIHPYNEDGDLMSEDELDDAGIDITEEHQASCVEASDGTCPTWNAAAGFGEYTISGVLKDDETGDILDTDQLVDAVQLPYPDGPPDDCCGYTNAVETSIKLDKDGDEDTGS